MPALSRKKALARSSRMLRGDAATAKLRQRSRSPSLFFGSGRFHLQFQLAGGELSQSWVEPDLPR